MAPRRMAEPFEAGDLRGEMARGDSRRCGGPCGRHLRVSDAREHEYRSSVNAQIGEREQAFR